MTCIAPYVLAAGCSSRMAPKNKLLLKWQGQSLINHVLSAVACANGEIPNLVLSQHKSAENIAKQLPPSLRINLIHNKTCQQGMGHSIATAANDALRQMQTSEISGLMLCFADMPLITPEIINQLQTEFWTHRAQKIIAPTHMLNRFGHPIIWPIRFAQDLSRCSGDKGAKSLLELHSNDIVTLEVGSPAIYFDVDTPEHYQELLDFDLK